MAFRKLPPDVARELLRHVKPPPSAKPSAAGSRAGDKAKNSSSTALYACLGLLGCSASLPYLATKWIGNLTDRDEPLTHAQVRRGAFLNSGTRDAGRDPNWDWKNGRYIYPEGFLEHLQKEKPDDIDLGPDMASVLAKDRRDREREQSKDKANK